MCRLVVLESGLGLESGLKSVFAGLGLGLESYGLGLGGSASKSFFKSFDEPPPKRQKLFANYMHTREHHSDTATDVSVAELLARYLRAMDGDCMTQSRLTSGFAITPHNYDKLIPAVRRTFAIPALSAPVERGFSHGGIVLRPNRARMSDKLLSELVFLKYNIV